jgi:hypothetical protein
MDWKEDFTLANRALLEEDLNESFHRFYYSLFNRIKKKLAVDELEHASGQYLKEFAQGSNQSRRGRAIPFTSFRSIEVSDAVRLCLVSSIVYQNYLLAKMGREIRNKSTRGHIQELIPYNKRILTKDLNRITPAEFLSSALAFVYLGRLVTEYEEPGKFSKEDVALSTYYAHAIYYALTHKNLKEVILPAFPVQIEFQSKQAASFKVGYGTPYLNTEFVHCLAKACFQEAALIVSQSKIVPVYHIEICAPFLVEAKLKSQFDLFTQISVTLPGVLIYSPIKTGGPLLSNEVAENIRNARSDVHAILVLANFVRNERMMMPIGWYRQVLKNFGEIPNLGAQIPVMENRDRLLRSRKRGRLKEYDISDKGREKLERLLD